MYLLLCAGEKTYIGITKNVAARFQAHKVGRGSTFTRLNKPLMVIATERFDSYKDAFAAEKWLKKQSLQDKIAWAEKQTANQVVPGLKNPIT